MRSNIESENKIGVLGLGIIGGVWAGHYHTDGVLSLAWNRTPRSHPFPVADSPNEVARKSAALQIVVADPPAVDALLDTILPELGPGKLVIQSSTIDPESSGQFHDKVAATGAAYLEAPFTGSKPAAEARKVVYYLGGDEKAVARAEPFLRLVSQTRFHVGSPPRAAALKLAMNLQIALMAEALCESLTFARAAGIPDELYFQVMRKNVAWSGLAELKEPKLLSADYSPQFSVKHMHKDIRLALGTGKPEAKPLTAAVERCFAQAAAAGWAEEDFIALFKNLQDRPT